MSKKNKQHQPNMKESQKDNEFAQEINQSQNLSSELQQPRKILTNINQKR